MNLIRANIRNCFHSILWKFLKLFCRFVCSRRHYRRNLGKISYRMNIYLHKDMSSYSRDAPSFKKLSITFPLEFQYPQYACFPGTSVDGLLFCVSFPLRCLRSTKEQRRVSSLLNSKWSVPVIALCQILALHQSVTFI